MKRRKGYTAVETCAALGIIGILAGVAMPTLGNMAENARVRATAHAMLVSLAHVRSQAVTAAAPVTLCPSVDRVVCANRSIWTGGWIAFHDRNGSGRRDAGEGIIETYAADPRVLVRSSAGRRAVTYRADGTSGGSNITLTLCSAGNPDVGRRIVVNNVGRARIEGFERGKAICAG